MINEIAYLCWVVDVCSCILLIYYNAITHTRLFLSLSLPYSGWQLNQTCDNERFEFLFISSFYGNFEALALHITKSISGELVRVSLVIIHT